MKLDWKNTARRERDAAVAEHVMGFKWVPPNDGKHPCGMRYSREKFWRIPGTSIPDCAVDELEIDLPKFTTDRNKTAMVIEKMRENGFTGSLEWDASRYWGVDFIKDGCRFTAVETSFSEAVCIAALRACGVEVVVSVEEEGRL